MKAGSSALVGSFLGGLFGTSPKLRRAVGRYARRIVLAVLLAPWFALMRLGLPPALAFRLGIVFWCVVLLVVLWRKLGPRIQRASGGRQWQQLYRKGRRCSVYYLRAQDGLLLYVGIAFDPDRRWQQHLADPKKQHWIWRVKNRKVDWYDSRAQAKAVESDVIAGRYGPRPFFNIAEATADEVTA